jgi:uncharacterized damage-inducible protein DinB
VGVIEYLRRLGEHGSWADARLLAAAEAATSDCSVVLRELAHVRGAQEIWIARIEGRQPTLPVWPTMTLAEIGHAGQSLDTRLSTLLGALAPADLARDVRYATTSGQEFQTPLGDILVHLLMHGQYHRGKANAALRAIGVEPASVDFIAWQRELIGKQ